MKTSFRACLAAGLAAAAAAGCLTSHFVATDSSFQPRARAVAPEVFLDRLPDRAYLSVGIIEVAGPARDFDLPAVVDEARSAGQALGCDVVVARELHRTAGLARPPSRVAAVGVAPAPPAIVAAPAAVAGRREFICGLFEPPTSTRRSVELI